MGTHLPQRFTCQPGPQRQPTASMGSGEAAGLAIGIACEPTLDSSNVPAAIARGRKYLVIIRFVSVIIPTAVKRRTEPNSVGAVWITSSLDQFATQFRSVRLCKAWLAFAHNELIHINETGRVLS